MSFEGFFSSQKLQNCMAVSLECVAVFSWFRTLGPVGIGIVMQQSGATGGLTRMFLFDYGMQLLKSLTVMFCIVFEVQKLGSLNVKECSQHLFNGGCLGLGFIELG
jgi:hypothetical protein